ncbi:MAG: glutathione S-transferase [Alphaproteobacteria bacterium]|nr:glutathione S-transferase [Alphaproteobacteria bacterium]
MTAEAILYGAPISYYTGKARAYLDWKGVPYREELASREVYKNVILPRVGWPVIPVVVLPDDTTLQDTTEIIDAFEAREPDPSVYPSGPAQRLAALLLEVYGDEWLVLPAMHYRWNFNRDWAVGEFGKTSAPNATPEEQRAIGEKAAVPFAGALPFLGVTPETIPAIEDSYLALLHGLDRHFSVYDYCFGSRPSIGDFGLLGPLYAHLYRDPKSGELMKARAPRVAQWVERMVSPPRPRGGTFLPNDEVPETLLPILRRMMREQMPVLADAGRKLDDWAADQPPGAPVPRALGMHRFTLADAAGERAVMTFSLWMLQRPLDFHRSLTGAGRAAADRLLAEIGAAVFSEFSVKSRLTRRNFKLVLA